MGSRGERAGVGIILALNPDESLYVHTVCPGSSAEHYLFPVSVIPTNCNRTQTRTHTQTTRSSPEARR